MIKFSSPFGYVVHTHTATYSVLLTGTKRKSGKVESITYYVCKQLLKQSAHYTNVRDGSTTTCYD